MEFGIQRSLRSLRSLDVNFRSRWGGEPEVRYGGAGGDSGLWAAGECGRCGYACGTPQRARASQRVAQAGRTAIANRRRCIMKNAHDVMLSRQPIMEVRAPLNMHLSPRGYDCDLS